MKNTKTVSYKIIKKDDNKDWAIENKIVLIPDTIGNYSLNADEISKACNYLIFCDLSTKLSKLNIQIDNYKNSKNFERETYEKKVKKLNDLRDAFDTYENEIHFKFNAEFSTISSLFAFMITGKAVNFNGGFGLTKKILTYYVKYFDIDADHSSEKTTLKNDIMVFINERLTDTSFKIDKINDVTLKHIVGACRKNSKMTDKGVKSLDLAINEKTITALENTVLQQVFIDTVGIKTGYIEKIKKSSAKYGLNL